LVPFCRCFDKNGQLSCVNQSRGGDFIGMSMLCAAANSMARE
jgi:hypothetical protein